MTEMDLKLYEFTVKLRRMAKEMDEAGDGEGVRSSLKYYGKAEAFREVAILIEKEFRDQ